MNIMSGGTCAHSTGTTPWSLELGMGAGTSHELSVLCWSSGGPCEIRLGLKLL